MDSSEKPSEEHKGGEPEKHDDTIIHSVARSVGTAIGVIASTATKVIGDTHPAEPSTEEPKRSESKQPESKPAETRSEAKPKAEKPRKASKKTAVAEESQNKLQASRLAKKKKKRAAHRIKLRRSNTKG